MYLDRLKLLVSLEPGLEGEEIDGEQGVGDGQVVVDFRHVAQPSSARRSVHDAAKTVRADKALDPALQPTTRPVTSL